MGQVQFSKSVGEREILPTAGKYGVGLDYPADVECDKFEWNSSNKPAYAKDDESRHFAYFRFKVITGGKTVFLHHHEPIDEGSGSDVQNMLLAMGVEVQDNGDGTFAFDPDQVAPRKLTGIEVGDPVPSKKNPGVLYSGNLTGVKVIG